MHRAGTDQAFLAAQQSLLSSGREQHALREEIVKLSREEEREMVDARAKRKDGRGGRRKVTGTWAGNAIDGGGAETRRFDREAGQRHAMHGSDQARRETPRANIVGIGSIQSSSYREAPLPRVDVSNAADIRRIELVGRGVTSISLAGAVEATLGAPTISARAWRPTNDEASGHNSQRAPLLWALFIRQCQLPSLIPVAGLLHNLDGLTGLGIHEVEGLALAGVERVLADARCLSTLTIRRCGLTHLPRLQSGSIEVLDLGENDIENTSGLETLFRLKELHLDGNNISTLADLRPLVPPGAGSLRELNLDNNPLQTIPRYAAFQGVWCPRCRLEIDPSIYWTTFVLCFQRTSKSQSSTCSICSYSIGKSSPLSPRPPEKGEGNILSVRRMSGYYTLLLQL